MSLTKQRLSAVSIAMAIAAATGNGSAVRALIGYDDLEVKLKALGTDLDSEYELIQKKEEFAFSKHEATSGQSLRSYSSLMSE